MSALLLAAPLAAFSALLATGVVWGSYDAHTHVFFATHYARDWFSPYDYRWYGGMLVLGYPPLLHQLVALASLAMGLEASYLLVSLASYLLVVYSSTRLAGAVGMSTRWTAPLVSSLPSLYLFTFTFGQAPTIMATGLSLAASYRLVRWLRGGGRADLVSSASLAALAVYAHHITPVFFLPLLSLACLASSGAGRGGVARFLAWSSLALLLSSPVAYGLYFFVSSSPWQAPIPHATRNDVLASLEWSLVFFWGVLGYLPALTPYLVVEFSRGRGAPLMALAVFYLLMGLGGATPLPRLLLGEALWDVLTYEKFGFWSSVLLSMLLADVLGRSREVSIRYLGAALGPGLERALGVLAVSSMLAAALFTVYSTSFGGVVVLQPPRPDVESLARVVDEVCVNGYYVTLGLGTWSRELSYKVSVARTLDGGYNTARRIPVLYESGVESIDAAKHFPGGLEFLDRLLSLKDELGIECVVLGEDGVYRELLEKNGFVRSLVVGEGVVAEVWLNPGGVGGVVRAELPEVPGWLSLAWGAAPLSVLALAVSASSWPGGSARCRE